MLSLSGSDEEIANSIVAVARRRAFNGATAFAPIGGPLSPKSQDLLEHLQALEERKLVVTPSFPGDLAAAATEVDGILLYAPLRESRKSDLSAAISAAEASGIPVLAVVTTK